MSAPTKPAADDVAKLITDIEKTKADVAQWEGEERDARRLANDARDRLTELVKQLDAALVDIRKGVTE